MRNLITWILCVALLVAPLRGGNPAAKRVEDYRISRLSAQLFFANSGKFSDDLFQKKDLVLWNVTIGEGSDIGDNSSATFVMVELSGAPGSYDPDRAVELVVMDGERVVVKRSQKLSVLSKEGVTHLGFWIYDTGCTPLKLIAKITGQKAKSEMTGEIPFECGE